MSDFDHYVIDFANLQRDIALCVKVEQGLVANGKAAAVDPGVADNRLDGATALVNAESFLQRNVDYVVEFRTHANFGATTMSKVKEADTKVTVIDISIPGAHCSTSAGRSPAPQPELSITARRTCGRTRR